MSLQSLVTSIMGNIGDRSEGVIGDLPTETVVLNGVNLALPQCVKLANPTYYDKTVSITLTSTSGTEIPIPAVVEGSKTYRVKDITHIRTSRSDGSPITIQKVTWSQFMEVSKDYDLQLTGVPSFLSFREGTIYINRIPAEDINVTLFVEVWPVKLTNADLEFELPIDAEWTLCVEACATYYCYIKLQQPTMANFWLKTYEDQKRLNSQVKRKTDVRGQGTGTMTVSGQPWLNPYVTRTVSAQ